MTNKIEGIHRQKRRLADGSVREHHYAWRGGPKFWSSCSDVREGSDAYIAALDKARARNRLGGRTVAAMVDEFLDSAEFKTRKPRTRDDYRKWGLRFAVEFAEDPAKLFEWPESRGELLRWRDRWAHSPKQADMAVTTAVIILNWARDRSIVTHHNCDRIAKLYEGGDRAEIIWPPAEVEKFQAMAPRWVWRALSSALETGLRPGDLVRLGRSHIKQTPKGRRIQIRTNKTGRVASIPVTPAMAEIIDETPADRLVILVGDRGKPLTERGIASAVDYWQKKAGVPEDLRLYDCRGTAVTKLMMAGGDLKELATTFGWSLRYAQNVIENYVALVPEVADAVLVKLTRRTEHE